MFTALCFKHLKRKFKRMPSRPFRFCLNRNNYSYCVYFCLVSEGEKTNTDAQVSIRQTLGFILPYRPTRHWDPNKKSKVHQLGPKYVTMLSHPFPPSHRVFLLFFRWCLCVVLLSQLWWGQLSRVLEDRKFQL